MAFFLFIPMAVISWIYRHELGMCALVIYWGLWVIGLITTIQSAVHLGFFVGFECLLAVAMLIHLGVNPIVPRW
ncbi:MAG: hypothetical protein H7343_01245 [Undibacterium sp.]|nr:hypothetical protein [Opitutaceae bacterium]